MAQCIGVELRSLAAIIDTAMLFVVGYLIASVAGGTTSAGFQPHGAPLFLWLIIALPCCITTEASNGATPGKRLVGLRVVTLGGSSVRYVLRLGDGFAFCLIIAILIWTSDMRKRLGDRVAGTVVLRD
jgi:uncharacterized RDD family membrane protein YckC